MVPTARGAAVLLGLLLASCATPKQPPPNLILLSIDTLRADHLGCYGYARRTSPAIDELARSSTLYEQALAPAPWTLPSHAALLTGLHPWALGIVDDCSAIPDGTPAVAEALTRAGYATAAFVDSGPRGYLGAARGFARGFASYSHAPFPGHGRNRYDARATVEAADRWLESRSPKRPFFLFLHTKSVHAAPALDAGEWPYDHPDAYVRRFVAGGPRFSWREGDQVRGALFLMRLNDRILRGDAPSPPLPPAAVEELIGLYDAGIAYVDEQVAALTAVLRRRGLARDTVLILTADHGEAFLEHRFVLHREVYENLLHVPLLIHDPRNPGGRRIARVVRLEDVAPTILRVAGVGDRAFGDARPLPDLDGSEGGPPVLASYGPMGGTEAYSLRDGRFKLIHERDGAGAFRDALFDLETDPGETSPLPVTDAGGRALLSSIEQRLAHPRPSQSIRMGREAREELRALGYVQ
jgi:arylsulfatase A-like enzyme